MLTRSRGISLLIALLCLGLVSLGQPQAAHANSLYNWLGGQWPGPGPGVCCLHLKITYESGMTSRDIQGWDDGRYVWTQSPALIYFDKGTDYTIAASDWYDANTDYVGQTYNWPCSSCTPYTGALTELNYYYTNMPSFTYTMIQGAAAHELGHVAGLAHHSGPYLMNPTLNGYYTPTSDEINGINSRY
jgi:hypothetical protein